MYGGGGARIKGESRAEGERRKLYGEDEMEEEAA